MGILDKFNDASRGVSEKAKNISEANNLKRKILYEEERIVEIFTDIGKRYYKNPGDDPAALKVLCDDIDTRRRRIKKMRYELNGIRGYKVCPKCDAEVNERFSSADAAAQDFPISRTRTSCPLKQTIIIQKAAITSSMLILTRTIDHMGCSEAIGTAFLLQKRVRMCLHMSLAGIHSTNQNAEKGMHICPRKLKGILE